MSLVSFIDENYYPDFKRNWDDQIFRERLLSVIQPNMDLLDVGAGAGIVAAMNFRSLARRVCGVDLDARVINNPFLDEGRIADVASIPYPGASFDLVFSDNVMEHLDQPVLAMSEIARVLRPGGKFLFKTPNRNHYMPLIARLTPHWFHQWINRQRGRDESDTFPTRYLCNSIRQVSAVARESGLRVASIELIEGRPEYLRMTALTYLFGLAYERIVNSSDMFSGLRIVMIATLEKSGS